MQENNKIFISLGTNLGNREENLQNAISELEQFIKITQKSSIYETEPVGYKDQDWFLNMVIEGETALSPQELLKKTQNIEKKLGRTKTFKDGPRIIDLDILFYNSDQINEPNLTIPHPEIQNRSFVLTPLAEIASKNNQIKTWTSQK